MTNTYNTLLQVEPIKDIKSIDILHYGRTANPKLANLKN